MTPNFFVAVPIDGRRWYDQRFQPPFEHIWAVHPKDLHLTVAFLGSVTEQEAKRGFSVCKSEAIEAFSMTLSTVLPLGKPGPFSALTLGLDEGKEEAYHLLKTWRKPMMEAAGLAPETRVPLPHVTVTRTRKQAGKSEKQAALKWLKSLMLKPIPVHARELALYTWAEERTEARYIMIDRVPLI